MRARLITILFALVAVVALMLPAFAAPRSAEQAAAPAQSAPAKPKKPRAKKKVETGIPKGVGACIDALIKMAEADPLIAYEGRPAEIINGGLLWNDPKSRCSVGNDNNLRLKLLDTSKAWREKDAARVRSLLQEIKSAAPQG